MCVCVLQFNFVGRILGPRGLTAKQLEAETGCKIMVRGKGSMRDKKKVRSTNTHIYIYKHSLTHIFIKTGTVIFSLNNKYRVTKHFNNLQYISL